MNFLEHFKEASRHIAAIDARHMGFYPGFVHGMLEKHLTEVLKWAEELHVQMEGDDYV